jgi:hypothetical protein
MHPDKEIYSDTLRIKGFASYVELFNTIFNHQSARILNSEKKMESSTSPSQEITNYSNGKFLNRRSIDKSNLKCFFCGRNGHKKEECWFLKRSEKGKKNKQKYHEESDSEPEKIELNPNMKKPRKFKKKSSDKFKRHIGNNDRKQITNSVSENYSSDSTSDSDSSDEEGKHKRSRQPN